MNQLSLFAALVAHPREGARGVLAEGRLAVGSVAVLLACAVASLNVSRFAAAVPFEQVVYGPERSPVVGALLESIGTARTAVLVYLGERVWAAALVLTALGPLVVWLLGSSAVLAAAALVARGPRVGRFFVYAGYATALALLPSSLAALAFEADPRAPLAVASRLLGLGLFLWLGFLFYRGIQSCFQVRAGRALAILVVAAGLFYLVPLVLILVATTAIVIAAMLLGLA